MAIVVNVYPGKDNLVRKVQIKTSKGHFDRPKHKLCLIATQRKKLVSIVRYMNLNNFKKKTPKLTKRVSRYRLNRRGFLAHKQDNYP